MVVSLSTSAAVWETDSYESASGRARATAPEAAWSPELTAASLRQTAGQARQAWLRAARHWKSIQTDAPTGTPPAVSEVADLVVWTGRLAYSDPNWKPGMRKASPVRPATSLAPTPAGLNLVADALRDATTTVVALLFDAADPKKPVQLGPPLQMSRRASLMPGRLQRRASLQGRSRHHAVRSTWS